MNVLGIETSGNNCSVSILDENKVIAEFNCNTGTTHSQNLMPMLDNVLKFANLNLEDIDVISCSTRSRIFYWTKNSVYLL